jgi:hypothetical protein
VITGQVSEWGPTNVRQLPGVLILPAIGVLVIALVRAPAPQRMPEQLLRMALLGGLAFWAVRGIAWFGLALPVALCALDRPGPARPADADRGAPVLNALVLVGLLVLVMAVTPPVQRTLFGPRPELVAAPQATADWLAANPRPGRMFNYQPWGSYLEFRLGPRVQVGFDSRIELAPADRWEHYLAVVTGRWDAERLLDRWGVDHVVTSRQATPALIELLESSGRWRLAFSMGDEVVYQRVEGG